MQPASPRIMPMFSWAIHFGTISFGAGQTTLQSWLRAPRSAAGFYIFTALGEFCIFEYMERYIDYITGAYIGLSTQISSTHLYLECIPAKLPIYCLIASRTRYMYVFISLFRDVY